VTLLAATLLGIIQGLTEFLPVSSSAHLILARELLGWDAAQLGLAFDVACHTGTLGAVLVYFRRDLWQMAAALPAVASARPSEPARRLRLIIAGTVPVVVAGLLWSDAIERSLRTPLVAACNLALVALIFFVAERAGSRQRNESSLTLGEAAVLGIAQASALVPGVSRSGATIVTAMFMGLGRDDAARFAFLLGVPAILAAAGKEGLDLVRRGMGRGEVELFVVGAVVSGVIGYFTVKYFIRYLASHSLRPFAWYRLALASIVLIWWIAASPSGR
jgi:undecaprenyl-diphosphatase